jgi:predicted Zn-dependent protease
MTPHVIIGRIVIVRRLGLLILALVLLGAGGCAKDQQVMAVANNVHTGLDPAVMEDPELSAYLQKIGERIVQVAAEMDKEGYGPKSHTSADDNAWMFSEKMRFYLVNSETLNAFTTGGEHMYIYNQLFLNCKSEDELAAVMAHEYAHIYARHVNKGMDRQLGQNVGSGVIGVGAGVANFLLGGGFSSSMSTAQTAASVASSAGKYVGMGFTRSDEDEADAIGFAFYTRAGWDPNHFADFFKSMIAAGYDKTPEMMSDHPKLSNRVLNTEKRVAELPAEAAQWRKPPIANAQQFAALQARSAQLAKTMPNDQTLQKAQAMLAAFPSCVSPTDQPGQKKARKKVSSDGFKAQFVPK